MSENRNSNNANGSDNTNVYGLYRNSRCINIMDKLPEDIVEYIISYLMVCKVCNICLTHNEMVYMNDNQMCRPCYLNVLNFVIPLYS